MSRCAWFSSIQHFLFSPDRNRTSRRHTARSAPAFETLEERVLRSATPIHFYPLNGNLADTMGGPALLADGGSFSAGRYVFDNNQGLRLAGALPDPTNYSVALVANLNFANSFYKKLIDFQERTSDYGLYLSGPHLQLYPGAGGQSTVTSGQDFQIVLTHDALRDETDVYLNGSLELSYLGSISDVAVPSTNVLTFFEDDQITHGVETAPGSVDYIAVYDHALTTAEVTDLTQAPSVSVDQTAVTIGEGQTAINTGTWAHALSMSASVGTVTQNTDGTWSWSYATNDGPEQSQTVTITATFDDASATTTFPLTVNDVPPTVSVTGPGTVNEGTPYVLTLAYADPGIDPVQSWSINWGDGTSDTLAGNPSTASHVYADGPNSYTITATATTEDGTLPAGNSVAISVQNLPPVLSVDHAAITVDEGQMATNSGTFSDVGHDAVTLSASAGSVTENADGTWSWSLATTDGPEQSQTVTITATDDDNASTMISFPLTVNDVPPTVSLSGSATVNEGAPYTLNLSYSDPVGEPAQAWTINWGDGTTDTLAGTAATATHVYADGPSNDTITASVTSQDGTFAAGNSLAVSVQNLPPVLTVDHATVSVDEGQTATNSGTFSDVGHDAVTLTASVGTVTTNTDGTWSWSSASTGSAVPSQTVTITATDDDGASTSTSFAFTVNPAALAITSLVVSQPSESCHGKDRQVTLTGAFSDASPGHTYTVTVAWGDGTAPETLTSVDSVQQRFTGRHRYAKEGNFTLTVTVSDDTGRQATKSTTAAVGDADSLEKRFDQCDRSCERGRSHGYKQTNRHRHSRSWTCMVPRGSSSSYVIHAAFGMNADGQLLRELQVLLAALLRQ